MLQILRAILVKVPPSCGYGAMALQILGVILSKVPPPLWLWSAGAPDPDGDPCHGAAAPPVVVERWSSSAPLALGRLRRTRGDPGAPQERPRKLNRRTCSELGGASAASAPPRAGQERIPEKKKKIGDFSAEALFSYCFALSL